MAMRYLQRNASIYSGSLSTWPYSCLTIDYNFLKGCFEELNEAKGVIL